MALNFTVSYTFSPNTVIASAQVNQNTSDVANVFTGLEAETKTLAKLKVDIDPTSALEVATKQYVDHYSTYRKPNLVYNSATVVNVETGIDGTSGECRILFPDGNLRTDSTTSRIQCNTAQVAALSGTAQSGLQTGTVSNNTTYAIYAVKTSDNTANFVIVADKTNFPMQANFATLNSNFGTNSWVFLGYMRYGDNSVANNVILKFVQAGNLTMFYNVASGQARNSNGIVLASTAGATTLSWAYAAGNGAAQVPNTITHIIYTGAKTTAAAGNSMVIQDNGTNYTISEIASNAGNLAFRWIHVASEGASVVGNAGAGAAAIYGSGWIDGALGVGSNPIL